MADQTFLAKLTDIADLSLDVRSFTFEALEGTPFNAATPGAHIDVHLTGGAPMRQYSLWKWDPEGRWGSVAVKREDDGRGGSLAMHALAVGTEIKLGGPRNNFPLANDDKPTVLLAGGIGATPIYAMADHLSKAGKAVKVFYMTRTQSMAAFEQQFEALGLGSELACRYDDRDGFLDLDSTMQEAAKEGAHIYVCGPGPMLDATLAAAEKALPKEQIHFERFSADPSVAAAPGSAFTLELRESGMTLDVPEDKTILDVIQAAGISADFGCTEGVCGACITDVIEGEIDHRDQILTDDERADGDIMCICVSRAKGDKLVLDM